MILILADDSGDRHGLMPNCLIVRGSRDRLNPPELLLCEAKLS